MFDWGGGDKILRWITGESNCLYVLVLNKESIEKYTQFRGI